MMPLCTSATRPSGPRCGCALTSLGAPWVAQRVCPMPVVDAGSGCSASAFSRLASLPARLSEADRAVGDQRDAGRVVAAVLQPAQPLDHDVAAPASRRRTPRFRTWAGVYAATASGPTTAGAAWPRHGHARGVARARGLPVRRARPRRLGRAGATPTHRAAADGRGDRPRSAVSATSSTSTRSQQVYLPLSRLLSLYVESSRRAAPRARRTSCDRPQPPRTPFVIGLAGSVAVGKSTTARVLQQMLAHWPEHPNVALVTTDGFLYPTPSSSAAASCTARASRSPTTARRCCAS